LNYADDRFSHKGASFKLNQTTLNKSARRHGIENIVSWSWEQLNQTDFYQQHRAFLSRPYHLSGFAFKPYITLQLLEKIDYGDIVIYYDSGNGGHVIDCSLNPLIRLCLANKGTVFHQWGEKNFKWTKRDCFVLMGCDHQRFHEAVALQATWFVIEKTEFALRFVREWLAFNLDERIASYENHSACGLPDLPGFVQHRGDQSIFTNLAVKYDIRTFYGAGGPANRRIGNFVRSLSFTGRVRVRTRDHARLLLATAKRALKRVVRKNDSTGPVPHS